MNKLPPLDGHSHLSHSHAKEYSRKVGMLLAMTACLEEATAAMCVRLPQVAWGVGCHPRGQKWQSAFDSKVFGEMIKKTAIVGEIGLDSKSRVPSDLQQEVFRGILEIVSDHPRIVSIHSYCSTGRVLAELKKRPISTPVFHWWTGSSDETKEAVAMGCYFTIHSAVARQSKWRLWVPIDRILVETDIGYADPPASIPCRVEFVEHLVAQQYGLSVEEVRRTCWRNLRTLLKKTSTTRLVPEGIQGVLAGI